MGNETTKHTVKNAEASAQVAAETGSNTNISEDPVLAANEAKDGAAEAATETTDEAKEAADKRKKSVSSRMNDQFHEAWEATKEGTNNFGRCVPGRVPCCLFF